MASAPPALSYDSERFTKATLSASPSLLYNNLSADHSHVAYVHVDQALVVPIASALSGDTVEKRVVISPEGTVSTYQVRLVTLGAETFFVIATAGGFTILDGAGKNVLHRQVLPEGKTVLTSSGAEVANHARGICTACSADGRAEICVGSAAGNIFVVEYDGVRFQPSTTIQGGHGGSITDLGSEVDSFRGSAPAGVEAPRPILVSADDNGAVAVWAANSPADFAKLFDVQLKSVVVAVAARGDQIIAAEVSGVVSFVSLATQRVYCELQAHGRYLNSMDVHPSRDVFATVAEDGTIGVWTLPREAREGGEGVGVTENLFATCWQDGLLTGVAFCGDRGDSLAVCAHDELGLCVWQ